VPIYKPSFNAIICLGVAAMSLTPGAEISSFGAFVGLIVTVLIGFGAQAFIDLASSNIRKDIDELVEKISINNREILKKFLLGNGGGFYIGFLERIMFFSSFLLGYQNAVAGWLALKVASKWKVWDNITAFPDKFPDKDTKDEDTKNEDTKLLYVIRRRLASHMLVTFQVGVIYNIVASLLGVVIAWNWDKYDLHLKLCNLLCS
jgi:hypothetical protein